MNKVYLHLNEVLTLEGAAKKDGRKLLPADLSVIQDGAVVVENDFIVWVGPTPNLPTKYQSYHRTRSHTRIGGFSYSHCFWW